MCQVLQGEGQGQTCLPPTNRLKGSRDAVRLVRGEEVVDMVSHQDVGVDITLMLGGSGSQTVTIKPVVLLGPKNRTAVIPALDHMLGLAGDQVPRESRHKRALRLQTAKRSS